MDSYQVVSKHSILSAQRRDGDTAGTRRRSKHGREALRHRLKQIGATGESDHSHDGKATTQSDFKVYDRGRSETELTDSRRKCRNRRHHAPTRRSGRIVEVLEKLNEIWEDFRSLKAEVLAESNKQAERRETEESRPEETQEKEEWNCGDEEVTVTNEGVVTAKPQHVLDLGVKSDRDLGFTHYVETVTGGRATAKGGEVTEKEEGVTAKGGGGASLQFGRTVSLSRC